MRNGFKALAVTLALLSFPITSGADVLRLTFDVCMAWRYDLAKNDFDPTFTHPCFQVEALVDDTKTGSEVFEPSGTTRIRFGDTQVNSPLWMYVDLGFDLTTATPGSGVTTVQDTFITETNQGTWTFIGQDFHNGSSALSRSLQYTNDPRLTDPAGFGSNELLALLESHIGKAYGYREDSVFPGGGYQQNGSAVLTQVVRLPDGNPDTLLQQLAAAVAGVPPGKSLSHKVALAQTYYAVPDIQATCAVLTDFVSEVTAQTGKKLTTAQAATFTSDAEAIMAAIGCK